MFRRSNWGEKIPQDVAASTVTNRRRHETGTKAVSVLGRVRHLVGKVVSVDEDWISKSKDWPYMWRK